MTEFTTWRSLVDGAAISAIPDSAIAQYDATTESSTGSITSISDQIGSFDLSGSAEVITNGINSNQTYRFDGTELMTTTAEMASIEPFTIMAVVEQQEPAGSNDWYWSTENDTDRVALQDDDDAEYNLFRGGDSSASIGTVITDPQIIETKADNDDELELIQDGESQGVETLSSGFMDGFSLAGRGTSFDRNVELDVGEVVVLEDHSAEDAQNLRESLASKWGISLE